MDAPPAPRYGTALFTARLLSGKSRAYVSQHTHISVGRLKYLEEGHDEPDHHEWSRIWGVLSSDEPPKTRPARP